MKRFAPLLMLLALGCTGSPTTPDQAVPAAAFDRKVDDCDVRGGFRRPSHDYLVGPIRFWYFENDFAVRGPCTDPMRVKLWFVRPEDGSLEFFGTQETTIRPSGLGTGHRIMMDAKAPYLDWESLPEPERWFPEFLVEVIDHGRVIGSYVTSSATQLIPNEPRGRNTHSVK